VQNLQHNVSRKRHQRQLAAIEKAVRESSPKKALIMRTVRLADQLRHTLAKACPNLPQHVVSALAVDLADVSEIGIRHDKYLQQLLKMRFPEDLDKAETLLIHWIDVELLFHNQYHLKSLKRQLPKALREISQELKNRSDEGSAPKLTRRKTFK
jgi:hypothetical protein